MKSRESLLRLKQFHVEEKRRQVQQIETMIGEFERMSRDLDDQIAAEEKRTGITDPGHFAYSTFAKSAKARRDNLQASAQDLKAQMEGARAEYDEAVEEAGKLAAMVERDLGKAEHDEPAQPRRRARGNGPALAS
jgi:flagellar export protein FliJ